jgi:hypothetical protein
MKSSAFEAARAAEELIEVVRSYLKQKPADSSGVKVGPWEMLHVSFEF